MIGAWLQLGPVIGTAGTVIGMIRTFGTLSEGPGISNPERLSADISEALVATATGFVFSAVGLVLLCIALFGYRYRAEWFFWFLVIYGAISLLGFPVGTVFGVVFLVFCLTRRQEFFSYSPTVSSSHDERIADE